MKTTIVKLTLGVLLIAGLAAADAVNYSYDTAGRLTKIDYGSGGSITYTYDAAGNITSRVVQGQASAAPMISSAKIGSGGSTVELTGTNLAPVDDTSPVTVTVNGRAARVLSTCSASVSGSGCRTDRVVIAADAALRGKAEIRVKNGSRPAAVWQMK